MTGAGLGDGLGSQSSELAATAAELNAERGVAEWVPMAVEARAVVGVDAGDRARMGRAGELELVSATGHDDRVRRAQQAPPFPLLPGVERRVKAGEKNERGSREQPNFGFLSGVMTWVECLTMVKFR